MENKSRDEIFFIVYDDIVKAPIINIMKDVLLKYKDYYNDFIDLSSFTAIENHDQFIDLIINRRHKNIFRSLRTQEFDCDRAWLDVYKRNPKLIYDSLMLPFGTSIYILLKQSFVKKIFIWSEVYDKRIHLDIQENFGLDIVGYVTGEFSDVIQNIPDITCFVIDQAERVNTLIDLGRVNLATICIADYGYNYITHEEGIKREFKVTDLYKLETIHRFRSTLFKPIQN